MSRCGEVTPSVLQPRLTASAKLALRCFAVMLEYVEDFQKVVEKFETVDLGSRMKLGRHILDRDEEHAEQAKRLVQLICEIFPKFSNWKTYVPSRAHPAMSNFLQRRPSVRMEPSRFSIDGHLPPEGLYYDTDALKVCELFHTSPTNGLAASEAAARLLQYGPNSLPREPPPPVWKILLNQVLDFMTIVLLISAVVSAALQEYIACAFLILVVVINVIIGFTQEYKAEKTLQALQCFEVPQASCIRDGEQVALDSSELVPGDIVVLDEGNMVPADLRLIEAANLQIIETLLTGESLPINKVTKSIPTPSLPIGDRKNMAFMSTAVTKGRATAIVVRTGKKTEVGQISKALASAKPGKTPLQKKLQLLGIVLSIIAAVLCGIVFLIGYLLRGFGLIEMITITISLAVSVIPEGLVTVVTITFALGVKRMAKEHALVRRLPAVETLGSVTFICSDKTGTLTEGKMKLDSVYTTGGQSFLVGGTGIEPQGELYRTEQQNEENMVEMKEMVCASVCPHPSRSSPADKTGD